MTAGHVTAPDGEEDGSVGSILFGRHLVATSAEENRAGSPDEEEPADPDRRTAPGRPEETDNPPIGELERYLLDHTDDFGHRPSVGSTVPIRVDVSDCERARVALRRVSVDAPVSREIELAAIALEISLERPLACARKRGGPLTLEVDVADCVLMALALSHAAENGASDACRQQARTVLDRIDRSTPDRVDVPSV